MADELVARVTELESVVAHQERLLDELNGEILRLDRLVSRLSGEVTALKEGEEEGVVDERPPHY